MTMDPTLPGSSHRFTAFCAPVIERLDTDERAEVYAACRIVDDVGAAGGFDVYNPYAEFYDIPDRDDVPTTPWEDQDRVLASDLLIHITHYPARSSGTGEMWDYAFRANLPQLILGRGPFAARRLMTWTTAPKYETEYVDEATLRTELATTLSLLGPFLTERRNRVSGSSLEHLAMRVHKRRTHLSLTRQQLATASGLSEDMVDALEENAEAFDPPLSVLSAISFGLKLTLAELTDVAEGRPRLFDVD